MFPFNKILIPWVPSPLPHQNMTNDKSGLLDNNQFYEYLIAKDMNISSMRLTWLVSKPVIEKAIFKPVREKCSVKIQIVFYLKKYENLHTFCCQGWRSLWCSFPNWSSGEKCCTKMSLVQACSVFNFLSRDEIDDLIMARTRATRGKNETKIKILNKSKFYSIFNINIQFSKTIGAAN